jgi:hypothetical protein
VALYSRTLHCGDVDCEIRSIGEQRDGHQHEECPSEVAGCAGKKCAGRQSVCTIVREIGMENECITHGNVQREDVKIWIRDYMESRDESRSARHVCFGDVTHLITHHVKCILG